MIEEGIQSDENQGQCRMPELPLYSPEMMSFLRDEPPIDCGDESDDWVKCERSTCFIRPAVMVRKGRIRCDFADIVRLDDFRIELASSVATEETYKLTQSDFARVKCHKVDRSERWHGTVLGVRDGVRVESPGMGDRLNVLMYGFDSLSRNAFMRKLPKSYAYLTDELRADVLRGYNVVGDGTPQALIPLLTGLTELELPETRKRFRNSNFVNVYPMIWKDYEEEGYVTAFNEDVPDIGTFSYRLNGFDEQPTHHYMRTYYLAIKSELNQHRKLCVGHQARHKTMLEYTKEFMLKYAKTPRFVFSFHGELSHDSINLIGVADGDFSAWLRDLQARGVLNNTLLIVMSDHGNRFAEVRNTLQGKQEERLPFFAFAFPEWWKRMFPQAYSNFRENTQRLATPFDVHATLKDLLKLQSRSGRVSRQDHSRAISLFNRIPETRSCADAYIEPHWCACLNWRQINDTSADVVVRAAVAIVDAVNKFTQEQRKLCRQLTLSEINWAAKLAPHDNLLRFKQNKDMDGFLADLTSSTQVVTEMYQIKLTTSPGGAIFEASVTHELALRAFDVRMSDVSRVNQYGDQAKCIMETQPELRKFCYCNE
ncbi:uncharacterized protein LOC132264861 isoform X2 [Phlebotomus argentipes]|nr:uncharacterized protein LOC132264861 isoform X2 [Phlebotomus argentipes]